MIHIFVQRHARAVAEGLCTWATRTNVHASTTDASAAVRAICIDFAKRSSRTPTAAQYQRTQQTPVTEGPPSATAQR